MAAPSHLGVFHLKNKSAIVLWHREVFQRNNNAESDRFHRAAPRADPCPACPSTDWLFSKKRRKRKDVNKKNKNSSIKCRAAGSTRFPLVSLSRLHSFPTFRLANGEPIAKRNETAVVVVVVVVDRGDLAFFFCFLFVVAGGFRSAAAATRVRPV